MIISAGKAKDGDMLIFQAECQACDSLEKIRFLLLSEWHLVCWDCYQIART